MELLQHKQIALINCPMPEQQWLMAALNEAGAIVVCDPWLSASQTATIESSLMDYDLLICYLFSPLVDRCLTICRGLPENQAPAIIGLVEGSSITIIDQCLRRGISHLLFTPLNDRDHFYKEVVAALQVERDFLWQNQQLSQHWQALPQYTAALKQLLHQLQPPVTQRLANCHLSYRQLNEIGHTGLIFDIAQLNEQALAFYCFDLSLVSSKGYVAAFVVRSIFNTILHRSQLPTVAAVFKQVNRLLRQEALMGQYPMALGYYHQPSNQLLLASAGMQIKIKTMGDSDKTLQSHLPLGTLKAAYFHQMEMYPAAHYWQTEINSQGGNLSLTCRPANVVHNR